MPIFKKRKDDHFYHHLLLLPPPLPPLEHHDKNSKVVLISSGIWPSPKERQKYFEKCLEHWSKRSSWNYWSNSSWYKKIWAKVSWIPSPQGIANKAKNVSNVLEQSMWESTRETKMRENWWACSSLGGWFKQTNSSLQFEKKGAPKKWAEGAEGGRGRQRGLRGSEGDFISKVCGTVSSGIFNFIKILRMWIKHCDA